jgi:hypothetical protein
MLQKPEITPEKPLLPVAPSRKAVRAKIRADKMKEKIDRKAAFRRKTDKKLAEKEKRKVYHKKANAQKKFQAKIEKKKQTSPR